MKSQRLDNMSFDEVMQRVWSAVGSEVDYWANVAKCKLAEYRRDMPRLEKFLDADKRQAWPMNLARWEGELATALRQKQSA